MTFADFEARCTPAACDLDDRLNRYISSPQEHDLALPTVWPLIYLQFQRFARAYELASEKS